MRVPTLVRAVGAAAAVTLAVAGPAAAADDDLLKVRLQDLDRKSQTVNSHGKGGPTSLEENDGGLLAIDLQSQEDYDTAVNAYEDSQKWLGIRRG